MGVIQQLQTHLDPVHDHRWKVSITNPPVDLEEQLFDFAMRTSEIPGHELTTQLLKYNGTEIEISNARKQNHTLNSSLLDDQSHTLVKAVDQWLSLLWDIENGTRGTNENNSKVTARLTKYNDEGDATLEISLRGFRPKSRAAIGTDRDRETGLFRFSVVWGYDFWVNE